MHFIQSSLQMFIFYLKAEQLLLPFHDPCHVKMASQQPYRLTLIGINGNTATAYPHDCAVFVPVSDNLIVRMFRVFQVKLEIAFGDSKIFRKNDILPFSNFVLFKFRVVTKKTPELRAHPLIFRVG